MPWSKPQSSKLLPFKRDQTLHAMLSRFFSVKLTTISVFKRNKEQALWYSIKNPPLCIGIRSENIVAFLSLSKFTIVLYRNEKILSAVIWRKYYYLPITILNYVLLTAKYYQYWETLNNKRRTYKMSLLHFSFLLFDNIFSTFDSQLICFIRR